MGDAGIQLFIVTDNCYMLYPISLRMADRGRSSKLQPRTCSTTASVLIERHVYADAAEEARRQEVRKLLRACMADCGVAEQRSDVVAFEGIACALAAAPDQLLKSTIIRAIVAALQQVCPFLRWLEVWPFLSFV